MHPKVTVVLPIYNGEAFLDQCLPPLFEMDYPNYNIIVVDDCSSDDTVAYLRQSYPQVRVIELQERSGHSKACNIGIAAADAHYVYLIENHTIVKKDTLSELMNVMLADEQAAICYSKQLNVYSDEQIVVEGKRFAHFVVNQQCERVPLQEAQEENNECPVDVSSSGTFSYLLDKTKFDAIGLFDEDYFIHIADYELTLRAKAAGYKCYYVPSSVSYHKSFVKTAGNYNYRGGRAYPAFRTYVIARNRWLTILSHYSLSTLLVLTPALLIYELFVVAFAIHRNVFRSYISAIFWLLTHPRIISRKRKHIQGIKRVKDADLLVAGELNFVPGLAQSRLERAIIRSLTTFLNTYWNCVKTIL